MPTLANIGSFSFHPHVILTDEFKQWLKSDTAIQIIVKQLKIKFIKNGKLNRLYFLRGRTGSGKSTLMISSLFEAFIVGSHAKLICTEPRVVLTRANATDVIRYNKSYQFGKQMGILTGAEKIICSSPECMYYCTPQILSDQLLNILQLTDSARIKSRLSRYKLIIIDEVHVLDLPMMSLLKNIKDCVDKFGEMNECPLFMFASATINIDQMISYYFPEHITNLNDILCNPYLIGDVIGSSNHPVDEYFLTSSEIAQFNIDERNRGRFSCYEIVAEYFYQHFYPKLFQSQSFITTSKGKIQCKDVLFFVPLTAGIETIERTLKSLIQDRPVFYIGRNVGMTAVTNWRDENRNKERVLIVGFARDYSSASDEILSRPIDIDNESLKNECKIFVATPVIETGKTISTLHLCIDIGLLTTSVYNPLVHDYNDALGSLKQIPANMNQTIQRMGRVGRESPGKYLHFYSQEIMSHFQLADTADTINNSCLSNLLLNHYKSHALYTKFDVMNENHYLYPTTIDILIRSMHDLIQAGFFTIHGALVNLKTSYNHIDSWILYAEYLYYIKHMSLFESLLLAAINRKSLPSIFTIHDIDVKSLRFSLNNALKGGIDDKVIEGIRLARNTFTLIKYSHVRTNDTKAPPSLVYIKNREFSTQINSNKPQY